MSNLNKSVNRDRKIQRRQHGHQIDGKSIFTIQEIEKKRSLRIRKEREEKEKLLNEE